MVKLLNRAPEEAPTESDGLADELARARWEIRRWMAEESRRDGATEAPCAGTAKVRRGMASEIPEEGHVPVARRVLFADLARTSGIAPDTWRLIFAGESAVDADTARRLARLFQRYGAACSLSGTPARRRH